MNTPERISGGIQDNYTRNSTTILARIMAAVLQLGHILQFMVVVIIAVIHRMVIVDIIISTITDLRPIIIRNIISHIIEDTI